jgi:hypothetical protein
VQDAFQIFTFAKPDQSVNRRGCSNRRSSSSIGILGGEVKDLLLLDDPASID